MWHDRFEWLMREIADDDDEEMKLFSIIIHPDTSGMPHIIGMIERFLQWALAHGEDAVEFATYERIVETWKMQQAKK